MKPVRRPLSAVTFAVTAISLAASGTASAQTDSVFGPNVQAAGGTPTTLLVSRAMDGGVPNGASTRPVISSDKRYTRVVAFESEASNLVGNDTNDAKDVFAVLRGGSINNRGTRWQPGRTVLISRTRSGAPANGPSFSASVDGAFRARPKCVAFLSSASNIVSGDTNGVDDAFLTRLTGGAPKRISRPGGRQATAPTTAVAVSGNCRVVAFVTGGKLYVSKNGRRARQVRAPGTAADPSFSTGTRSDLVFGAGRGAYLLRDGRRRARLVGRGGSNPAYNDIKRQVVAYEKRRGGRTQIGYHDLGRRERIISRRGGGLGNGSSRNPVIGNSGFYVTFESDASNLQTNAGGATADNNGQPDVYLYTDTRKITLVQSVEQKGEPVRGGGRNPGMSFYSNYIVFDSPARLGVGTGAQQVFMRYVGGI
jgi:hypothetical protein